MTHQCRIDDINVYPCETLFRTLSETNPTSKTKKGLFNLVYSNVNTHKKTREFYIIKSGDYVGKGIVLNYCPFCGEKLLKE